MSAVDQIETVARAIATALGDDFDHAFRDKTEWMAARGKKGGRFRDINEAMQPDYTQAAIDAIRTVLTFPRDEVTA